MAVRTRITVAVLDSVAGAARLLARFSRRRVMMASRAVSSVVTRAEVQQRLEEWRAGRLSAEGMHEWAEARYLVERYETEDHVVNEVLSQLDRLDINLLVSDDAPALLALLQATPDSLPAALAAFELYGSSLDMTRRRAVLRGNSLYAAFCGQADA